MRKVDVEVAGVRVRLSGADVDVFELLHAVAGVALALVEQVQDEPSSSSFGFAPLSATTERADAVEVDYSWFFEDEE